MTQSLNCYHCAKSIPILSGVIHRSDDCPYCGFSLRCCKMCKFYDPRSYNECRETIAERIVEKEKANFCDFFIPGSPVNSNEVKDSAQKAFDALFKK